MEIFHLATGRDWAKAKRTGSYTTSTRGRTLAEEGFLHAAREDQWRAVRQRYYADLREPLLLLTIDTDRLTVPWREDPVGDDTYPHIYGPLSPDAVVRAVPLPPSGSSFARLFLGEVVFRIVVALIFMAVTVLGAVVVGSAAGSSKAIWGLLAGAVVAGGACWGLVRWWHARGH